jgi:hypothetical protein
MEVLLHFVFPEKPKKTINTRKIKKWFNFNLILLLLGTYYVIIIFCVAVLCQFRE